MSELRAGSYLKLLSNPEMDLMEVVDEQAPPIKTKERHTRKDISIMMRSYPMSYPEGEWDDECIVTFPEHLEDSKIEYECTHGWRFANCSHQRSVFHVEPLLVPSEPDNGAFAYNGSPEYEDWSWHRVESVLDESHFPYPYTRYGLVAWDAAVWNELYPGYPEQPHHLVSTGDDLDIDEELVRAYDVIRPAISSNMSLLTTLAELKDVVSLFKEPMDFANRVVHALGRKRLAKTSFKEILTDPDLIPFIAKSIAGGHLYNEFGLKQTERDVVSLYSTFISLDSTVRDILAMTGENTRHYSVPLYEEHESVFEHSFQDRNWIISKVWDSVLTRKFVVTMKYTTELVDAFGQPISPNDPFLVKMGAAMDKLGLNMNPAVLWDIVPFSFVVDYFVGIGDWLERFKRNNLNLTFSVSDSCYSVKRESVTQGTTRRWTSVWNGRELFPDHPLAACDRYIGGIKFTYQSSQYDRVRFQPTLRMLSGLREPDFSVPNFGQFKILSSLLTANLPIFGKRR